MPDDIADAGLEAAMARLEAAEAAEPPIPAPLLEQKDGNTPELKEPTQAAAQTTEEGETKPDSLPTDTPAEAAKPKPATNTPPKQEEGSKFARDKARRDDSWKALNAEKEAHAKAVATLKAEQDLLARERAQLQEQRAKVSNKYTPEQYEQAAASKAQESESLDLQADGLERKAEKAEENGEFGQAEKFKAQAKEMRDAATYQRGVARQMKEYGEHLRKNPEPTVQQIQAQKQQQVRDYTLKAAQSWPDLAKDGSPFQQTVARHLQAAREAGLDVNEHPSLMYHCARLTAAETAAARVPGMEKELGELRAKVKELETLTAPGGGQSSAQVIQMPKTLTHEQEGEELRAIAMTT